MKRIAIGSDHAGFALKQALKAWLQEQGHAVTDVGANGPERSDYPDYAHRVAEKVASGESECGLLVCGTGVGMAIVANKHRGVRAAACSEAYSARMARAHNDANVLCVGARVVGGGVAIDMVRTFFQTDFEGGRHESRVAKFE